MGVGFGREVEIAIFYEGVEIGTRRVDFLIGEKIIVELKAISKLEKVHLAQAINYLEAFGFRSRAFDQLWVCLEF